MRLLTGIAAAALAGLVAAGSQEPAEVYLFRSSSSSQSESSSSASPRLPKELARHIFLQRTSQDRYGSPLRDLPNTIDEETAISYINTYGKSQPSLFDVSKKHTEPKQLVIIVEGYDADKAASLKNVLAASQDAFLVSDPPSSRANDRLMADFKAAGVASEPECTIGAAVNPFDQKCWFKLSPTVVRYDLQKSPIDPVGMALASFQNSISSGQLEALVILLPESSRSSPLSAWSVSSHKPSDDLRRRQNEFVLTDEPVSSPKSTNTPAPDAFWESVRQDKGKQARVPACFLSANSCETRTNNCSGGHGVCINRYKDQPNHEACFSCHCMATVVRDGTEPGAIGEKTQRWGGNMCQKKDVSIPFWLLTGFTITLVGAITFAISLLYSVGEEQLPGVIGAGVSRSK